MERGQRLGLEILRAWHTGTADPVVLDVLPYPFIRVQLWRLPGQEEQAQLPVGGRGELLDGLGAVDWMTVQDQKDRAGVTGPKDLKAKALAALHRLQKLPEVVRSFFRDPNLRYITA